MTYFLVFGDRSRILSLKILNSLSKASCHDILIVMRILFHLIPDYLLKQSGLLSAGRGRIQQAFGRVERRLRQRMVHLERVYALLDPTALVVFPGRSLFVDVVLQVFEFSEFVFF